jgi:hypothetical protein
MNEDSARSELADEIERHIGAEEAILADYHVLIDKLPDGPLSVLVNQISTEEEMHHFLLTTLAEWLRDEGAAQPADGLADADRREIADRARVLQEHEQTTIDACTRLKERVSGAHQELLEALLDVLILDSRKHHLLLGVLDRIASR